MYKYAEKHAFCLVAMLLWEKKKAGEITSAAFQLNTHFLKINYLYKINYLKILCARL